MVLYEGNYVVERTPSEILGEIIMMIIIAKNNDKRDRRSVIKYIEKGV